RVVLHRPIVLTVIKPLQIQAADFATAGDEPDFVPFNQRRTANPHQWPVVDAAGVELLAGMLPEELAVLLVEAEEAAEVDFVGITPEIAEAVVRAGHNLAPRDDGVAVGLAAERGDPFDELGLVLLPGPRLAVETAGVETGE